MQNPPKGSSSLDEVVTFEDASHRYTRKGPEKKSDSTRDALTEVLETLYSEHRYIDSLLHGLEQQASRLQPGKVPDFPLLLDVIDYLNHFPDKYHHPREDLLFATMLQRSKSFQPRIDRLLREHEVLNRYNEQLFRELTRVAAGGPVNRSELLHSIERYIRGYRQHLEYEATEVFPRAKGVLTRADLKKLAARTHYQDDPLFGAEVQQRYHRLGRSLQAQLGMAAGELVGREMSAIESAVERLSEFVETVSNWTGERRSPRAADRSQPKARPSWQARFMNTCTRTMMKPLMRYGSVESMRTMTGRFDQGQERMQAEDIDAKPVSKAGYEGEWVRIKGRRARHTVLYFPGGGFVMRTAMQHRSFVARICRAANARALIVHYRLAPEVPFPGGLEDCLAAYHDLLKQGTKPQNITIAGDSAGGGLVLSTLLALRDEGAPMPANAIILSPLADLTYSGESRRFNKHKDPMLPTHRASLMHKVYIGNALPEDRYISPVLAEFDGLPPILGQVGSTEILLDDTTRAFEQARKAGVPFFLEVWEQMPHVFPIFSVLPESRVALERIGRFIADSELDELPERHGRGEVFNTEHVERE